MEGRKMWKGRNMIAMECNFYRYFNCSKLHNGLPPLVQNTLKSVCPIRMYHKLQTLIKNWAHIALIKYNYIMKLTNNMRLEVFKAVKM
jgi:hypothetical protein